MVIQSCPSFLLSSLRKRKVQSERRVHFLRVPFRFPVSISLNCDGPFPWNPHAHGITKLFEVAARARRLGKSSASGLIFVSLRLRRCLEQHHNLLLLHAGMRGAEGREGAVGVQIPRRVIFHSHRGEHGLPLMSHLLLKAEDKMCLNLGESGVWSLPAAKRRRRSTGKQTSLPGPILKAQILSLSCYSEITRLKVKDDLQGGTSSFPYGWFPGLVNFT